MNSEKTENIDLYIETFPKEVQLILQKLRQLIKKIAPHSEESHWYILEVIKTILAFMPFLPEMRRFKNNFQIIKQGRALFNFRWKKKCRGNLLNL